MGSTENGGSKAAKLVTPLRCLWHLPKDAPTAYKKIQWGQDPVRWRISRKRDLPLRGEWMTEYCDNPVTWELTTIWKKILVKMGVLTTFEYLLKTLSWTLDLCKNSIPPPIIVKIFKVKPGNSLTFSWTSTSSWVNLPCLNQFYEHKDVFQVPMEGLKKWWDIQLNGEREAKRVDFPRRKHLQRNLPKNHF